MNSILMIALVIGGIAVGIAVFYILSKKRALTAGDSQAMLLLQNQLSESFRIFQQQMKEMRDEVKQSSQSLQQQAQYSSGESTKLIKNITEELVRVGEGQKQVMSFTDQLRSLQDILKNPKQRGILGEYYLETLLKNVLPPGSYAMQYKLGQDEEGSDLIPDAVVFVRDRIIPVDSKFSLENYNRISETNDSTEKERLEKLFVNDLKNRIVETSKYIQPSKGTMDFAFMFIPHEAIYYDLLINKIGAITEETENLIQRAANKYKVIIVSPTSFLAYLQTVLQGLKALQIEESAKDIRKNVEQLSRHIQAYEENFLKVGKNIGATVNAYSAAQKEFKKIDKDVLHITGESPGFAEPLVLEKPEDMA